MRITVLGAGAMGALFGGRLAEVGHTLELLDVNASHIDRVQRHGLTLMTDEGTRTVRVPMMRPEQARQTPDWLLVFTKTLHTTSALQSVKHLLGQNTRVLSLQNGLGNAERMADVVPSTHVAVGVTTVPADLVEPGVVASHGAGYVRMMMADGHNDAALDGLSYAMCQTGVEASVDPGVTSAIWSKVAFNAALNSVCAVSGCTVGGIGARPDARALAHAIVAEVLAVADAHGVPTRRADVGATLDHALDHHTHHQPSMLQDLLARRRTEIDAINGAVVRLARRHGVAVPCTEALETLVRLKEAQLDLA